MKQKIINENNNGWNGNNQNPWGQNNNRQDFENPFNGLQKIISKFLRPHLELLEQFYSHMHLLHF